MVTSFGGRIGEIAVAHLQSAHWHSETDWKIATPTQSMHALTAAIITQHRVEILLSFRPATLDAGVYETRMYTAEVDQSVIGLV